MEKLSIVRSGSILVITIWLLTEYVDGAGNLTRPSVVTIGVLLTYNSVIGRSALPAIQAAIDDVNADPTVLRGTNLRTINHDTNCSAFLGTVEGTRLTQFLIFYIVPFLSMFRAIS